MLSKETDLFSELTDEQREVLEANWRGAQDMLAHLMTLHELAPTPHGAVLSAEEIEAYTSLDDAQLAMVLRAAVVSLCGAAAWLQNNTPNGLRDLIDQLGQDPDAK